MDDLAYMDFDAPFLPPPDIVLDIPVPPSVNVTRRIDHAGKRAVGQWRQQADKRLMLNSGYRKARTALGGKPADKFELQITLDETQCALDPDNTLKVMLDYLKSRELIMDDSLKHVRCLTIRPGIAPAGMRVVIKPIEGA